MVVVVMVEKEEAQPRIGGPTGGKSRNEGSYLGGSLSLAITLRFRRSPGKVVGDGTRSCPCSTYLPRGRWYGMTVELYKDEKLMPGRGGRVRETGPAAYRLVP